MTGDGATSFPLRCAEASLRIAGDHEGFFPSQYAYAPSDRTVMRLALDGNEPFTMPPSSPAGVEQLDSDDPVPRPLVLFSPVEVRCIVTPSTDEVGQPASVTIGGEMHRIVHAVGPQRITGVWWEGRDKTRDYYDVELPLGRRLWIFQVQESRRWFWQGEY